MPTSGQLIQRLRADSRTARIPLALVCLADEKPEAERVAGRYPLCVAVMRTHDAAHTQFEVARHDARRAAARSTRRTSTARACRPWSGLPLCASERQQVYDLRGSTRP